MAEYLTIKEVAGIAGVSVATVRRWLDEGLLGCFRFGGTGIRRIRREQWEAFAKKSEAKPVSKNFRSLLKNRPKPTHRVGQNTKPN